MLEDEREEKMLLNVVLIPFSLFQEIDYCMLLTAIFPSGFFLFLSQVLVMKRPDDKAVANSLIKEWKKRPFLHTFHSGCPFLSHVFSFLQHIVHVLSVFVCIASSSSCLVNEVTSWSPSQAIEREKT